MVDFPFLVDIWLLSLCCRYASLYFCCAIEDQDNELITLEIIHRYVELLDKYFGSVGFCLFFQVCCIHDDIVNHIFLPNVGTRCKVLVILNECLFIFISTGLWAGHYFQLWEGLLHPRWVPAGWGSSGDVQKERIEGHWAGWLATGGKAPYEINLGRKKYILLLLLIY